MASYEVVADDLGFTEGPTWLPDGNLAVTSITHGKVYVIGSDGIIGEFDPGGGPNGLAVMADGSLLVTQNGGIFGAPGRVDPGIQKISDGRVEYLLRGHGLGAPNDLCFGPDGRLYITDPRGEADPGDPSTVHPGRIWRYDLEQGKLELLYEGIQFPNGIRFGRDGQSLFVAETATRRVLRFEVEADEIRGPNVFCEVQGSYSDGLCLDTDGNVWVAATFAGNIQVFDPDGKMVDQFDCGENSLVTSCCFGGPDGRTLYVTTFGRVLAFHVDKPGLPLYTF